MLSLHPHRIPRLPYDVLRQLLQTAARVDSATALNLAVLSRAIQPWIEEIIYANVMLSRLSTANAFLRTINTAKSKYPGFFAYSVKSLFICPDMDPLDVVTLLSTCRGVVSLSYWPLTHSANTGISRLRNSNTIHDPWDTRIPTPSLSPPFAHRRETRARLAKFSNSVALHNIDHLAPRRLSLLLSETHPILCFQPAFDVPFFQNVTHLTIVNRWEEWAAWAGRAISSMHMPALTHVKFDLAVGHAPPEDISRSRARWLNTVTDGWSSGTEESCPTLQEEEALSAWTRKVNRVASALTDVLNATPALEVCVLVLRFESSPARTAKQISRLVSARINENRFANYLHLDGVGDEQAGFDPRLVFAWEKEPFRYSHAHSGHELMIWRAAEAVAKAQSYMSGYTVLNCDYLI